MEQSLRDLGSANGRIDHFGKRSMYKLTEALAEKDIEMPDGIISTVIWKSDPDLTETCIETLRDMFSVTRQRKGFRNIRLLRSAHDPHELVLIQEWDTVQDHQDYMQFRVVSGDMNKLMTMTVGPMQIHYWTSSPLAAAEA